MTNLLAFTVVIPLYKGATYIASALDSVLSQSYPASEIIVVDDESPDASAQIVAGYGKAVRLVHQKNQGQAVARNYGVSLASSEWISFIDQDDLWLPNHLEEMAHAIIRAPKADLCYSGRREIIHDQNGNTRLSEPKQLPREEALASVLTHYCPFQPSSTAIRRATLLSLGGFDPNFNGLEDWQLWLRVVQSGSQVVHSPNATMHYRVHAEGATNRAVENLETGKRLVNQTIAPMLPVLKGRLHCSKIISRLEAEASLLMRENHLSGAGRLMLKSILRNPFHQARRYKVALHMLLFS